MKNWLLWVVYVLSLCAAANAQRIDTTIFYHQYSDINGIYPYQDGFIIHGVSDNRSASFVARLNAEGHVIWERPFMYTRGAAPLKNGRIVLLVSDGTIWTCSPSGVDFERLPLFVPPNKVNDLEFHVTEDYFIVTDNEFNSGINLHSVSFFDREDGSFLYRHRYYKELWRTPLIFKQVDQQVFQLLNLNGTEYATVFDFSPKKVELIELPEDPFRTSGFTFHDHRFWIFGSTKTNLQLVSYDFDFSDRKVYELDNQIAPESWGIESATLSLSGEYLLLSSYYWQPGTFSLNNSVRYTIFDSEEEQIIWDALEEKGGNGCFVEFSSVHEDFWYTTGTYNFSDIGERPPAFVTKTRLRERTSATPQFATEKAQFFPNPVQDQWSIKGPPNIFPLEIFNTHGQVVKHISQSGTFNLSDLRSGLYHLRSRKGTRINSKLVKI